MCEVPVDEEVVGLIDSENVVVVNDSWNHCSNRMFANGPYDDVADDSQRQNSYTNHLSSSNKMLNSHQTRSNKVYSLEAYNTNSGQCILPNGCKDEPPLSINRQLNFRNESPQLSFVSNRMHQMNNNNQQH